MYTDVQRRLEELRGELRSESISWAELVELNGLGSFIDPSDVELLDAAGIPVEAEGVPESREENQKTQEYNNGHEDGWLVGYEAACSDRASINQEPTNKGCSEVGKMKDKARITPESIRILRNIGANVTLTSAYDGCAVDVAADDLEAYEADVVMLRKKIKTLKAKAIRKYDEGWEVGFDAGWDRQELRFHYLEGYGAGFNACEGDGSSTSLTAPWTVNHHEVMGS